MLLCMKCNYPQSILKHVEVEHLDKMFGLTSLADIACQQVILIHCVNNQICIN